MTEESNKGFTQKKRGAQLEGGERQALGVIRQQAAMMGRCVD